MMGMGKIYIGRLDMGRTYEGRLCVCVCVCTMRVSYKRVGFIWVVSGGVSHEEGRFNVGRQHKGHVGRLTTVRL
jgi:hypothetical protein